MPSVSTAVVGSAKATETAATLMKRRIKIPQYITKGGTVPPRVTVTTWTNESNLLPSNRNVFLFALQRVLRSPTVAIDAGPRTPSYCLQEVPPWPGPLTPTTARARPLSDPLRSRHPLNGDQIGPMTIARHDGLSESHCSTVRTARSTRPSIHCLTYSPTVVDPFRSTTAEECWFLSFGRFFVSSGTSGPPKETPS
jgi:hypothetical protein